jgi:hypothetical protein
MTYWGKWWYCIKVGILALTIYIVIMMNKTDWSNAKTIWVWVFAPIACAAMLYKCKPLMLSDLIHWIFKPRAKSINQMVDESKYHKN